MGLNEYEFFVQVILNLDIFLSTV